MVGFYMDKVNFDPKVWGPGLWCSLHMMALSYPESPTNEDMKAMYRYVTSLPDVLPCDGCKKGMKIIIERTNFGKAQLANRDTLFAWTVLAHSMVNEHIGKPRLNNWVKWKKRYMKYAG
jgi:hypothetical protein